MSKISGLRNDMNKGTFYKERKINRRFDFLSKQSIVFPLILDIRGAMSSNPEHKREAIYIKEKISFLNIQHTSVIIDFSFLLNFL